MIAMPTNPDLLNALVAQKNELLAKIVKSHDVDELCDIHDRVRFVGPVWLALGYGYKLKHVKETLLVRVNERIRAEKQYLVGCRKNCSTYRSTEATIRKLESLLPTEEPAIDMSQDEECDRYCDHCQRNRGKSLSCGNCGRYTTT